MNTAPANAAEEWRRYWPMVLAATVGMSFYSLFAYSNQMFIQPLEAEFHWARRDISFGYSIYGFWAFLFGPLLGMFLDRIGARRIGVPGLLLSTFAFAALAFTGSDIWTWFGLWFVLAVVGLAVKSTVWTVAVSTAFTHGRAMAISVMLSGSALAQFCAPLLGSWLIQTHGWRNAYIALGLGWGGLAFVLCYFLFRDAPRPVIPATSETPEPSLPGLTFREGLTDRSIILIIAVTMISSLFGSGVTFQLKPILSDTSLGEASAAYVAATAGITGVLGKLLSGWLLDKTGSRWVAAISVAMGAIGYFLLIDTFQSVASVFLGVLILGAYSGATLSIPAFLISRYAGLRAFGAIYGLLGSMLMLGSTIGPPLAGAVYDKFHSYHPMLWLLVPVCLANGALLLLLGKPPAWDKS